LKGIEKIGKYYIGNTAKECTVLFTSSRKFKGLEADVIILNGVDAETFNSEEARRVFYVGVSRAKSYLEIISSFPIEEEV